MSGFFEDVLIGLDWGLKIAAFAGIPYASTAEKIVGFAADEYPQLENVVGELSALKNEAVGLWATLVNNHEAGTLTTEHVEAARDFVRRVDALAESIQACKDADLASRGR